MDSRATTTRTPERTKRITAKRLGYAVLALFQLAFIVTELAWSPNRDKNRARVWAPILFLLLPDVALIGEDVANQRLHPTAAPFHRALHRIFPGPVLLIAVGFLIPDSPSFLSGLGWGTHIAFDRALGNDRRDDGRGPNRG